MSSVFLQMRRPGCWGFQENHLLQQSGHSQHTVESAEQTQIYLVFHTHWDLTDKTGDRTEIILPSTQVSKNFGLILVQWTHTERTFWRLFYMWNSARNLPLWLFQNVISRERQNHFGIHMKTSCFKKSYRVKHNIATLQGRSIHCTIKWWQMIFSNWWWFSKHSRNSLLLLQDLSCQTQKATAWKWGNIS